VLRTARTNCIDLYNFALLNAVAGKRFPLQPFSRRCPPDELLCQTAWGLCAADGLDAITQVSKLLVSKIVDTPRCPDFAPEADRLQPPYRAKPKDE
jgi:hypothetical protein